MMKIQSLSTLFALTIGALTFPAAAHEVWIEDTPDGQLIVRFGEGGDNYEKSPGALDMLTLPFGWTPNVEAPAEPKKPAGEETRASREERAIREGKVDSFQVQKKSDGLLLVGSSSAKVAQFEVGFTVIGKPGDPEKPARKPFFYARWQPAGAGAAQPALNFDLVPTGTEGKVCVYLRGKPLAGAKVTLLPPGAAEQELTSDADGMVQFPATKPGLYLMTSAHQRESTFGYFGGKPYDAISHNTSLAWRVGAAPAAAKKQ